MEVRRTLMSRVSELCLSESIDFAPLLITIIAVLPYLVCRSSLELITYTALAQKRIIVKTQHFVSVREKSDTAWSEVQ